MDGSNVQTRRDFAGALRSSASLSRVQLASAKHGRWLAAALAAALCTGVIVSTWSTGAVPQILFGRDVMYLLDGAWKWHSGIFPYRDYQSPTGPLPFLLISIGMQVSGGVINAIPAGLALYAAVLLPLALYTCFVRLHPLLAAFAAIVLTVATCAPRLLQFGSDAWSYAALYQRCEIPLLGILLLTCFVARRAEHSTAELTDGVIAGMITALLFSSTAAVGVWSLLIAAAGGWTQRRRPAYYFAAVGALLLGFFVVALLTRAGPLTLAASMASETGRWLNTRISGLPGALRPMLPLFVVFAVAAASCCCTVVSGGVQVSVRRRVAAALLLLCVVGAEVAVSPRQLPGARYRDSALLVIVGVIFLTAASRSYRERPPQSRPLWPFALQAALAALASLFALPAVARDAASILTASKWEARGRSLSPRQTFQSTSLEGMQIQYFGGDPPLSTSYVGKVEEGLALLARTGNAERAAVSLDYSNPFNVARRVKPARTAAIGAPGGLLYVNEDAVPAGAIFDERAVVLVPKLSGDLANADLQRVIQLYQPHIDENCVWAGESEQWRLYHPKAEQR